jgi:hypothetical protein
MTASIRINGSSGPLQVTPGTPCVLSNFSNVGVLGWQWVLADKPAGSTAVLTGATAATASFTPDLPGTYLVRLTTYSDAGRTVADAASSAAAYIRFTSAPYWRLPAAGETSEVDASRGWAAELLSILKDVQAGGGGGGAAPEVIQYVDGAPGTVAVGSTTTLVVVRTIDPTDITFTLPAPSAGRRVTFKQAGVSAGRALYVAPHGAETVEQIDGPSTFLRGSQLAYGLAWTFQYDATDAIWRLVWSTESGLAFDAFTTLAGQAYVAIPPTDGQIPVFDADFVEWKFQDNIPKDGSVSLAKLADLSVQSVVAAAAAVAATVDHVTVDTQAAGGNVALTVADRKQPLLITKVSTTLQSISITPPGTVQLHGRTAGTSVILPYSIRTDRPSWIIWRESATKWWILPALANGSRWATVATPSDLPNVSGSATQSTDLAYGDTCVTTSAGPYICSLATPGAAVWVPMAVLAGQLGQTSNLPDVRGIRETSGPTLLTIGSIADGQVLVRAGSTIIGATPSAGPQGTMVKPNLRLAGISPVPVTGTYRDIAWSPSLGLFCAVGSAGVIVTSPDGITWTPRTSGTVYNLVGVCWAAGLGLFVACGNDSGGFNAEIRTSPDGITWTQRYTAANPPALNGVATNAAGTTVIAFGTTGLMLSSTNGTSWTSRTSGFGTDIILQATWNGTLFVAVGGSGKISTSPDGITWTARTSGTASVLYGVTANPATGRCVAIGATGTVLTSADGITWTTPNYLQNVGSGNLIQIGFGDGVFIVGPFSSGTTCWASPDGVNWSLRPCNTGANFGTGQPTRGAVFGNGRYVWPAANVIVASDVAT